MADELSLRILTGALRNLRAHWPAPWPGLRPVLEGCVHWLTEGHDNPTGAQARHFQHLLACADFVEHAGRDMQLQGLEPAYHNRLHVADVLASGAMLLRQQRRLENKAAGWLDDCESTCLLALLVHDVGHDGRINQTPWENEKNSAAIFRHRLAQIGMDTSLIDTIEALVMLTEPAEAVALHRSQGHARAGSLEWMGLIVTEADILASALPCPGDALTEALSIEWSTHSPDKSRHLLSPQGRLGFLRHAANFSTQASQRLGMRRVVQQQIAELSRPAPARPGA